MTRCLQHPDGQTAQLQAIALPVVPLIFLREPGKQQVKAAGNPVGNVAFVNIHRQVRPSLQQVPHSGAMVKMAMGQQDHNGGAAGIFNSFFDALRLVAESAPQADQVLRLVAGIDNGTDLLLLVLKNIAVGANGPYGQGIDFHDNFSL